MPDQRHGRLRDHRLVEYDVAGANDSLTLSAHHVRGAAKRPRPHWRRCVESAMRSGHAPTCTARPPGRTAHATARGGVTIAPHPALASLDRLKSTQGERPTM